MAWSRSRTSILAAEPLAASRAPADRRAVDLRGPLPAVIAFAACGLYATTFPPISDHAWQFYMAERLLDGARLYVDVGAADMHPPLFTWLAVAIAWIGRLLGSNGLTLYPVFVWVASGASLYAFSRIAPRSGWVLVALVAVLLPLAGPSWGQGEHLALIGALPYLAGAGAAIGGRRFSRGASIAIGAAAAAGLALKPHFALVWIAVEGVVAIRRGWRSLFRTESIVIATAFVIYVIAALVLTPELFAMLPWLMKLYPKFAPVPFSSLLIDWRLGLLGLGLLAASRIPKDDPWEPTSVVLASCAVALYAALLLQGKGWEYHWYPVCAVSILLCALVTRKLMERHAIVIIATALCTIPLIRSQRQRTLRLLASYPVELPAMLEAVEANAPAGASILGLTHLLQPAFPLVNIMGARWSSPYAHLWMVPAIYADAWTGRSPARYRQAGEFAPIEQEMFDRLWAAIERDDPDITILQAPTGSGFDMRAYFETDPRFRDRFARSPVLDTVGRYILLGRPGPRPVTPATVDK